MASLGSIEKSANILAKKLQKRGFKCDVEKVQLGGGYSGASYIQFAIERGNYSDEVNFLANNSSSIRRYEIEGKKWSEMKAEFLKRLEKECY